MRLLTLARLWFKIGHEGKAIARPRYSGASKVNIDVGNFNFNPFEAFCQLAFLMLGGEKHELRGYESACRPHAEGGGGVPRRHCRGSQSMGEWAYKPKIVKAEKAGGVLRLHRG